ncbi:MAG: glycosyltransferase family 4 protein [Rhodospirillales bacterium]|nr:glycosyltransferase family 4 protein [Rhodospirillales bacterium]
MKILFAIKRMEGAAGGAERVFALISSRLAARGHDVAVLSFDPPGTESFYPLAPGIRRIFLPLGDPSRPSRMRDMARRIPALRRAVRAESPDLVIGFMHSMFVPMALALFGTGIPLIASEHIVPDHYRARRAEFILLVLAAFIARRMTVISESVRGLYPAFLRRKICVVPNPVETAAFAVPDRKSSRVILSVGRLDPQKDQTLLIEAFSILAARHPEWALRIVGEGALRSVLEERIGAAGLEGRVHLPGIVRDIAGEYARAAIFVLPSLYESFGLTSAEAMASGLPVIGFSDCPGTNELVVDGETGILVRVRTPEALAQAMESLMQDSALSRRYGQAGAQRLGAFDPERITTIWENLVVRIVNKV